MKKLLLLLLLSTYLFSQNIEKEQLNNPSHSIQLATFAKLYNVKKVIDTFKKYNIYVLENNALFKLYFVNFRTQEEALTILSLIQNTTPFQDAFYTLLKTNDNNVTPDIFKNQKILSDDAINIISLATLNLNTIGTYRTKKSAVASFLPNFDSNVSELNESLEDDTLFSPRAKTGFSLYEAIIFAMSHNEKLKASKSLVTQETYRLKEKEAGHLPIINLSGNTGHETRSTQPDGTDNTSPVNTDTFHYNKAELYLTITENLYNGGAIENAIDNQKNRLDSEIYKYQESLEKSILDTIKSYFDVIYSEISLKINRKNMQNYKKILDIVTLKEKNGAATKGDVNFITANVENAKNEMVKSEAKLSDAIANYEYLLGYLDSYNQPFESDIDITLQDLNTTLKLASKNFVQIKKNESLIKSMRYAFESQKSAFQPKVDFQINGESRKNFDLSSEGIRNKANALLVVNYNLYNGHRDEAKALRLYNQMKQYQYTLKDIKRRLIFDTKVLHKSVSSLTQSTELSNKEVKAARKVVTSYWTAFKHGTQDLQALQLAQRNLNTAEINYTNNKKNALLSYFKLLQKEGILLKYLDVNYAYRPSQFKEKENINIWH